MSKRALSTHPVVLKLERIFVKMEEEGIRISWINKSFFVECEGVYWEMRDLEDEEDFQLGPTDLPPSLEYKLVRE